MKINSVIIGVSIATLCKALVIPHDVDSIEAFSHALTDSKSDLPVGSVAPLLSSVSGSRNIIEDSYIIVFKDEVDSSAIINHHVWVETVHNDNVNSLKARNIQHPLLEKEQEADSGLKHTFSVGDALRGYTGKFLPDTVEAIRHHEAVAFVERDSRVFASELEVEKNAPWGLARVSHREPLSLGTFNKYLYEDDGGEGVTAYVVDTGTNIEHVDFEGRASWGATIPNNDYDEDNNGHGTHCSGTIAGKKYGIAKKAHVVAVKVLGSNGSGSMSDVIKGVEFVAEGHLRDKGKKGYKGTTANMSLGGGKSTALDLAVNGAVRAGVHFAVAAGNDNDDACNYSPAAAENAVTVGATALSDDRAYFSNWGKCVDIFAPGVNIQSTYMGSKHAVTTMSGTSMASPHVCGLLTYFLSLQPSTDSEYAVQGAVTPAQLKKNLIAFGTEGIISDLDKDSPNVLAFNGAGKSLGDFWNSSEKPKESLLSILPFNDEEIKDQIEEIAHDFEGIFNRVKDGFKDSF